MHITVDPHDDRPIYLQLVASIKELINRGKLKPGDRLPTVRQLAGDFGVNLNTVARAYRELAEAGVLNVRQGRGAYVVASKGRYNRAARKELKTMTVRLVNEAVFFGLVAQDLHRLIDAEIIGLKEARK